MKVKCLTMAARKRTTKEIVELIAARASLQAIMKGEASLKITATSIVLDEVSARTRLVQALMPGQDQEIWSGLMGIYAR